MENIWDMGAEIYAELTPRISFYQEISEKVFDFFDNLNVINICDLGCGSSGLIAGKILEKCPNIEHIYCIDSSKKMIEVLSNNIKSSKIKIYNADAEKFAYLIDAKIDVFIINSAFWLFYTKKTLKEISDCLNNNGKVIFNIAEWDYRFPNHSLHPKYKAIDEELKKEKLKIEKSRGSKNKISEKKLTDFLRKEGFLIRSKEIFDIVVTKKDWLNFYSIPSISKRSLPELPEEFGMRILKNAISKMPDNEFPGLKWIFFEIEKNKMKYPKELYKDKYRI
jgi:SAM-dependent methyltransferase